MYKPRLKGSHYEMGYHYGALLYKNNVRLDQLMVFDEEKLMFGTESLKITERVYPNIIEEIKGMADGLHVQYESFGTFIITAGAYSFDIGCSNLAIKTNDKVYFGRNHDMFTILKKTTETALYRPDKGYYFVGQGDALIGKEDGVNEHGLAVGMNFIYPKAIKPGLNFLIIVRYLLETCRTTSEAISILKELPCMTSHNIILADASGDMAVVEMCSEKVAVRYPEKHYMTSTNHFQHPDMKEFDNRPQDNWFMTIERNSCMEKALAGLDQIGQVGLQDIKDILSGRKGPLSNYDKSLQFDTLWSFCTELTNLEIERAEGNPSRSKYIKDTRLAWALSKR